MNRKLKPVVRRRWGIEALEVRATPAGLVTAQLLLDGTLQIRGDNNNNSIEVYSDGDELHVAGIATAVNGVAEARFDADAVARLDIDLGRGNDFAILYDLALLDGASVADDQGSDTYIAEDLDFSGAVLSIATGRGRDTVEVDGVLLGGLFVDTGEGQDIVDVDDAVINIADISTGEDADLLEVTDAGIGSLLADTGGGGDSIYLESLLASALIVNAGGGGDYVYTNDVVALTTGLIDGGAGNDVIERDGLAVFVQFRFEGFL